MAAAVAAVDDFFEESLRSAMRARSCKLRLYSAVPDSGVKSPQRLNSNFFFAKRLIKNKVGITVYEDGVVFTIIFYSNLPNEIGSLTPIWLNVDL